MALRGVGGGGAEPPTPLELGSGAGRAIDISRSLVPDPWSLDSLVPDH